jgi:Glycosyl transferases group 1
VIAYLLDDTGISPRVQSVLAQADALIARGQRVRIVTTGAPVTWRRSEAEFVYVDNFLDYDARDDDVVVGTDGVTLQAAYELAREKAVQLCQDSASLIVDDEFYRPRLPPENEPLRVLLSGQSQADVEGIEEGYGAVAHARWFHQKLELVRVSPWAPSREEPLDSVDELHVALTTNEMTRLMHSCDVLIAPSHAEEGFGLPAAEALASGLATVLTSIPSYLAFDERRDYALFAPERNAVELGEKLIELLSDEELRARLRTRGREVAEQWRSNHVADRLEAFFLGRLRR